MLCEDHYSFAWAFLKVFFSYWVSRLKYFASTVWRFQQSWCQCLTTLIVLFQSLRPEQELFWVQEQMTYSYLFLFISLTVCEIHIKSFWDSVRVLGFLLWQGFVFFFEKIVSWEHWERLERLQNTLKSSFLLFAKLCWVFLSRVLIIHVCKSFGKQWKYQLRGKYTFLQNTSWKKLFISHHVNVRARGILFWEFFETC